MARKSYRKHRGGNAPNPSSYSDGQSYMLATVGKGDQQYNNVFESSKNTSESNAIVGLQGQKAGSRRMKRKGGSRKRKGGFWSQVINNAIVPFGILGMQQTFRSKRSGKKGGTRRRKMRH
jgi:hypothetical protein